MQRTRGAVPKAGLCGERGQNEVYPVREGGRNKSERSQMVTSGWGKEERYSRAGEMGAKVASVAARRLNGQKGTNR